MISSYLSIDPSLEMIFKVAMIDSLSRILKNHFAYKNSKKLKYNEGGIVQMKKEKRVYCFIRKKGFVLLARREISFELKLTTQLMLDTLCFQWNKKQMMMQINDALDERNKDYFLQLSAEYELLSRNE